MCSNLIPNNGELLIIIFFKYFLTFFFFTGMHVGPESINYGYICPRKNVKIYCFYAIFPPLICFAFDIIIETLIKEGRFYNIEQQQVLFFIYFLNTKCTCWNDLVRVLRHKV